MKNASRRGNEGRGEGDRGESWGGEVITSSRGSMRREPGVSYFPATFLRNYRAYPVTCVTRLRNYAESGHLISVILQRGLFRRAVINDRAERASNVHLLLLLILILIRHSRHRFVPRTGAAREEYFELKVELKAEYCIRTSVP